MEGLTKALVEAAIADIIGAAPLPHILVGGGNYAMMKAAVQYEGHDRRRIKREMNKAWRKWRRADLIPTI